MPIYLPLQVDFADDGDVAKLARYGRDARAATPARSATCSCRCGCTASATSPIPDEGVLARNAIRYADVRQTEVYRIGKKRAGRVLDGRTWDEYPAGAA